MLKYPYIVDIGVLVGGINGEWIGGICDFLLPLNCHFYLINKSFRNEKNKKILYFIGCIAD